jgi:type VI secretion system protein VasG
MNRIGKRISDNHNSKFDYDDAVVEKIVSVCNDPDSGGRKVDNIATKTLLPALSRQILNKAMGGKGIIEVWLEVKDGEFG